MTQQTGHCITHNMGFPDYVGKIEPFFTFSSTSQATVNQDIICSFSMCLSLKAVFFSQKYYMRFPAIKFYLLTQPQLYIVLTDFLWKFFPVVDDWGRGFLFNTLFFYKMKP